MMYVWQCLGDSAGQDISSRVREFANCLIWEALRVVAFRDKNLGLRLERVLRRGNGGLVVWR